MSAKVVQLVWSSFFGLPRKSLCPTEAVHLLGVDMLRELAIEHGLFTPFVETPGTNFSISELCEHSVQVARTAHAITMCETQDPALAKQAYFAGLMHDIGKLLLVHQFPDRYAAALRLSRQADCGLWEAEREVFGASHAEVGSYLLALWAFQNKLSNRSPIIERQEPAMPMHLAQPRLSTLPIYLNAMNTRHGMRSNSNCCMAPSTWSPVAWRGASPPGALRSKAPSYRRSYSIRLFPVTQFFSQIDL